jgi:hypothetical protein
LATATLTLITWIWRSVPSCWALAQSFWSPLGELMREKEEHKFNPHVFINVAEARCRFGHSLLWRGNWRQSSQPTNNLMWSTLSALHENPTRYRGGRGGKRRKKKRTTNKSRHWCADRNASEFFQTSFLQGEGEKKTHWLAPLYIPRADKREKGRPFS